MKPEEWKGDRWWVVALFEPVAWEDSKVGSLKRLIVEELRWPASEAGCLGAHHGASTARAEMIETETPDWC
jgi:hypothetical protein